MRSRPVVDDIRSGEAEPFPDLLAGKLAPTLVAHPTQLRPRLLSALGQAVQHAPLTLVSGPAGAGKTSLVASWLASQPGSRHIAWLTLDEYDDDPATFWSYVVEALTRAGARLAGHVHPVPGESLPASFVPRLAAALLGRPEPTVLVLDNADHLTDRRITGALDLLVRHAGDRLRLVLCARADPQVPLHAHRLAGTLAEIRAADLAFDASETADLLAAAGVATTPQIAAALCEQTEGWAVGLRLAVAPLKQGMTPEDLLVSLLDDDGSVTQYLFEEVLRDQPASVRRFLLRVSVTDELWPDLVDRLAGRVNGRRILAGLAHTNAFVEHSPGAPGGYRIHALFRQMLRAQLAYGHPAEVPRLHRICAGWYAEAGQGLTAVDHAVAARDWSFATHLLVEDLLVGRVLAQPGAPALHGMTALPGDLAAPEAVVVRAASVLSAGGLPAVDDLAVAAEAAADPGNGLALRASAAVVSVAASALSGATGLPPGIPDTADALVAALPESRQTERREMTAVLSAARLLRTLASDRPGPDLVAELGTAAAAAHAAGSRPLRIRPLAYLALLEALGGRLHRAERLAREAASGLAEERRGGVGAGQVVALARAWVHLDRYELEEAREWADRADGQHAATPDARFAAPLLAVVRSGLLRVRHEYPKAMAVLEPHLRDGELPRWIREEVVGAAARARAGGAAVPEPPDVPDPHEVSTVAAVENGIMRACRHLDGGAIPAAVGELAKALDLAGPELLRWPFLDAPLQVRRLLRTHPDLRQHAGWLSLTATPASRTGPSRTPEEAAPLVQHLSEREREVLTHLSELLSTAEIAATMFISVNTVRTHIRSILRKLSATRRNQAVRRARELGVL